MTFENISEPYVRSYVRSVAVAGVWYVWGVGGKRELDLNMLGEYEAQAFPLSLSDPYRSGAEYIHEILKLVIQIHTKYCTYSIQTSVWTGLDLGQTGFAMFLESQSLSWQQFADRMDKFDCFLGRNARDAPTLGILGDIIHMGTGVARLPTWAKSIPPPEFWSLRSCHWLYIIHIYIYHYINIPYFSTVQNSGHSPGFIWSYRWPR